MDFTFLNPSGAVAFFRSDAEQADWTQEEMTLLCTFPLNAKKMIEDGMTVLFRDPATDDWQAYEIINCQTFRAEGYQQFSAEDIVISELTNCHIPDTIELTDVTAKAALGRVLSGTGWRVGTDETTVKSVADIGRGSAWEGVITIRNNWNVNLLTRVTVNSSGITGRYIDIIKTEGTFRGLRLSIDKNCTDPCVTVDRSEVYTALYAYGASYVSGDDPEHQETKETNIRGITWEKTSEHPAKPAGQNYLEWPEKTALYGRNGKPRFGYYQNATIKDPGILIQKVWETLKSCADPKISITGTITDFRRFGYTDEPLRLYDMAIVDFGDITYYKQIIKLTVNLLDPTGNTPTIGDYIPNIIYINRETENYATGGSTGAGGGRGGGGGSRSQKERGEFRTDILQNERNIILQAMQVNENSEKLRAAGIEIDPITGVVIYAEDVVNGIGANFRVQSNQIKSEVENRKAADKTLKTSITQTENLIKLETSKRESEDKQIRGQIKVQSNKISLVVEERDGRNVVNTAKIVTSINADHGSEILLQADTINLSGYVTIDKLSAVDGNISNLVNGNTIANSLKAVSSNITSLVVGSSLTALGHGVYWQGVTINGTKYHFLGYVG